MKIDTLTLGLYQTNCYIVHQKGHIVVIDPGASFRKIKAHLDQYHDERLDAILLTHGHFDHIGAVNALYKQYHCNVYISKYDERLATSASLNCLYDQTATIDVPHHFYESSHLELPGFSVDIIHTPGHTDGSVCLLINDILFSGDTIFYEGVGRTDLYTGSMSKLTQSIRWLQHNLPSDTQILCGHGQSTTWNHELQYNPYF